MEAEKMRMMLVGAGAVGESMLKILKWRDPKGEWLSYVLVGDYDLSRAEAVAGLLADDRFSAVQINATDKEQMKSLIREHKIDFVMRHRPLPAIIFLMQLMKQGPIMPIWEPGLFLWKSRPMGLELKTAIRNL